MKAKLDCLVYLFLASAYCAKHFGALGDAPGIAMIGAYVALCLLHLSKRH